MNRDQAKELIDKYNKGLANTEEKIWVENWFLNESHQYQFSDKDADFLHLKEEIWKGTLLKSGLGTGTASAPQPLWPRMIAAAAIFIIFAAGFYFFNAGKSRSNTLAADIAPGGNKAILTLSNGQQIVLNEVAKGELSTQSGISVSKSKDGELVYTVIDANKDSTENNRNTISTPKGGQYTIMLSDGTKVMLNSASSLTFPTSLKGRNRQVELSGEAYFEVAKQKDSRFRVVSGLQTVEVLGTHFNVNAYTDEETIKTTLLEGSVKVSTASASAVIEPGEQAVWNRSSENELSKRRIDIDKETAWINGVFTFEGDDLKSIMRQVARWYDVNVIYEGPINEEKYFGGISRNSKLSAVFKILELNNVNFKVSGKTVKVSYNQRSATSDQQK